MGESLLGNIYFTHQSESNIVCRMNLVTNSSVSTCLGFLEITNKHDIYYHI